MKVGAVNADEHKQLGSQFGVKGKLDYKRIKLNHRLIIIFYFFFEFICSGFPTIKIFGANKRSPIDYNNQRTAQAIADAALAECKNKVTSQLGGKSSGGSSGSSDVVELTDSNFDKLVLDSEDVWLVEFFAPW